MAEFSSDDPISMTDKEIEYVRRAAGNIGIGPRSYWANVVARYFEERTQHVPEPTDLEDDIELRNAFVAHDPRYHAKVQELLAKMEGATLAVGLLYLAQDELEDTVRTVETEASRMLIDRNRIRASDITVADITGE